MKRFLTSVLLLTLLPAIAAYGTEPKKSSDKPSGTGSKASSTTVHGYTKKEGTTVQPYHRTTPDSTQKNNYSTRGNVDPYTGKTGTKTPTH